VKARIERLTAGDLLMVVPDDFGWPQDIGAFATLDGRSLFDDDGRFRLDALRTEIESRLPLVPRFRQLLHRPRFGLGWPLWVDAPTFEIADHVGEFAVAPPADKATVLAACERLRRKPLDRSRPLWEMWFLTGMPDQRVGLFIRLHHAIADGVAGVATLAAFVDVAQDAAPTAVPSWMPARMPTAWELFADNVLRRLLAFGHFVMTLLHPVRVARQVRRVWPSVSEAFAEGAPRTSLNRTIGADRRLAVVAGSLDRYRQIAHAHSATVNDVLLTVVAGGLRDLLLSRGERVDELVLRAFVPVSLHRDREGAKGNLDGAMVVPLPVGEPDDLRRLRLIAAETKERKQKPRAAGGTFLPAQRAFMRLAAKQHFLNAYVANVPGPPIPLFFAGAPILEFFPIVPIMGNMTLGVGALSYAGQLNVTAVADRDTCPDVAVFVDGLRRSLDGLAHPSLAETATGR
jgi:WS/DGAT/MGAT family acyltransferase